MKTINSTEEFNALMNSDKPIFIDFYASWCGPCKMQLPIVEELSQEYDGRVEMVKVDVDENPELAAHFQIRSIPALYFIKDKTVIKSLLGLQTKATLQSNLDEFQTN